MKATNCKYCKVIKALSGPKYYCTKHEKKCVLTNAKNSCLGFKFTVDAERRWKVKLAEYRAPQEK